MMPDEWTRAQAEAYTEMQGLGWSPLVRPWCRRCGVVLWRAEIEFMSVNPPGGYGRSEFLLCETCLSLGDERWLYIKLRARTNCLTEKDPRTWRDLIARLDAIHRPTIDELDDAQDRA